jgi:hypothetical protein
MQGRRTCQKGNHYGHHNHQHQPDRTPARAHEAGRRRLQRPRLRSGGRSPPSRHDRAHPRQRRADLRTGSARRGDEAAGTHVPRHTRVHPVPHSVRQRRLDHRGHPRHRDLQRGDDPARRPGDRPDRQSVRPRVRPDHEVGRRPAHRHFRLLGCRSAGATDWPRRIGLDAVNWIALCRSAVIRRCHRERSPCSPVARFWVRRTGVLRHCNDHTAPTQSDPIYNERRWYQPFL